MKDPDICTDFSFSPANLRASLWQIADMGGKAERFIAQYGTAYTFQPMGKGRRPGSLGNCFMNASRFVDRYPGMTYVEGFATSKDLCGIPFLHAWCVSARGLLVDPTWTNHASTYVGVKVPRELLWDEQMRTRCYGVLYEEGVKFNERFVSKWHELLYNQTNPPARLIRPRRRVNNPRTSHRHPRRA